MPRDGQSPKSSNISFSGPLDLHGSPFTATEYLSLLRGTDYSTAVDPKGNIHTQITSQGYKLKKCVYCAAHRVRSKSGYIVYCRFMCQACDVALCKGSRACFQLYHRELFQGQGHEASSDDNAPDSSQYIL